MNKKKVNGIRHVVELRENVMMNENKTHMKFLSVERLLYDRHSTQPKKREREEEEETLQIQFLYTSICPSSSASFFFIQRRHYQSRRVMSSIDRQFL